jgi:hypothetical protein
LVFEAAGIIQDELSLKRLVYVGLGSIWFTDFQMAHKSLGIRDMVSMEADKIGFKRAQFNLPFKTARVKKGYSTAVLPALFSEKKFLNRPWFIWLDYTCGLEERVVKDIRLVIESAPANSVFVTTFNALGAPLGNPKDRPERIRRLLGAVVPDTISRDDCQNARLPETLLKLTSDFMVSVAASFSRPGRFVPAFRIAYSDSTPMITVGGVLPTKRNTVAVESLVAAPSWPAIVKEPIVIPPLTIKEFTALQAQLPRPQRLSRKLVRSLGFDLDADHIRCFGKFYRYYPIYAQITS